MGTFAVNANSPPCAATIGAADRQAHSQALGLRLIEGLKGAVGSCRIDLGTRILHCNRDGLLPGFFGLDEQFLQPILALTSTKDDHSFEAIYKKDLGPTKSEH